MSDELNFLDHYFLSVHNKLEADALLFNRKLPHAGLVGSENELVLSDLLRQFLPPRFGIETSGIVIDHRGRESRQTDIIIYDAWKFPNYLRKVFPIELVYGVIEVKTTITSSEASVALDNLTSFFNLDFHPMLTPYWKNKSAEEDICADPPFGVIFGFRSEALNYETFAKWFPRDAVHRGYKLNEAEGKRKYPEIRTLLVAALDKGIINMESSNAYVQRMIPTAEKEAISRSHVSRYSGQEIFIDPAKALLWFLEHLWQRISQHKIHPAFDIRSYMSSSMDTGIIADQGCE